MEERLKKRPMQQTREVSKGVKMTGPRKPFVVAPGCKVFPEWGRGVTAGNEVMLTASLAKHYQKLGMITVEIRDFDDDEPDTSATSEDTDEAPAKFAVDTGGEEHNSGVGSSGDDEAERAVGKRRRSPAL